MANPYHFVDFHSHILPGIDDGSKSVEESLAMLDLEREQGVCVVAVTPHFYAMSDTPEHFLRKRAEALGLLRAHMTSRIPAIIPGAEVYYFEGIDQMAELDQLRLFKTNYLLLEMPDGKWTPRMVKDILALQSRGMKVMMAHIERFADDQDPEVLSLLRQHGVLFQVNASFFTGRKTQKKAFRMLSQREIAAIGTDTHNLTSRAPNFAEAVDAIRGQFGEDAVIALEAAGKRMILGK